MSSLSGLSELYDGAAFSATVDLIRSEHVSAARELIKDQELLKDLESEIYRDCEGLRGYLFAAQASETRPPQELN